METESCSDRRWFAVVLHLNRLPRNWTEPGLAWKRVGQKGSEMLKILDGRNGGEKNQTLSQQHQLCVWKSSDSGQQ